MKGRTHHSAAPERSTRFEEEDLSEALDGKSTLAQKAEDMESVERQTKRVYSPLEKHTRIEPIKQFDRASENPPQIDNCLKGGIQVRKLQPLITGDTGDKAEESNNIQKQIIKPSIRGRSSLISPEMQHRQLHNTQDWSPKLSPMRKDFDTGFGETQVNSKFYFKIKSVSPKAKKSKVCMNITVGDPTEGKLNLRRNQSTRQALHTGSPQAQAIEEQVGSSGKPEATDDRLTPVLIPVPNHQSASQDSQMDVSRQEEEGILSNKESGDSCPVDPLASPVFSVNRRLPVIIKRDSVQGLASRHSQFFIHPQAARVPQQQTDKVPPAVRDEASKPGCHQRGFASLDILQQFQPFGQRVSLKEPATANSPSSKSTSEYQKFKLRQKEAFHQLNRELLKKFKLDTSIIWKKTDEDVHFQDVSSQLKLGFKMGEGAFAAVFEGFDRILQKNVCVKVFEKSKVMRSEKRMQLLEREVQLWSRLPEHRNLCEFYRLVQDSKQVCLVMEFCGSKTVERLLAAQQKPFSESEARGYFSQLLRGVGLLHESRVFHRDLTFNNVIIDRSGVLKIIDFGLSTDKETETIPCGTPLYFSPQLMQGQRYSPKHADLWSLGVILYRMVSGSFPFGGRPDLSSSWH